MIKLGKHIRQKIPNSKIIIWDDMIYNMNPDIINSFVSLIISRIFQLKKYNVFGFQKSSIQKLEIEPMIWAYMEDVVGWYQNRPDFFRFFNIKKTSNFFQSVFF